MIAGTSFALTEKARSHGSGKASRSVAGRCPERLEVRDIRRRAEPARSAIEARRRGAGAIGLTCIDACADGRRSVLDEHPDEAADHAQDDRADDGCDERVQRQQVRREVADRERRRS